MKGIVFDKHKAISKWQPHFFRSPELILLVHRVFALDGLWLSCNTCRGPVRNLFLAVALAGGGIMLLPYRSLDNESEFSFNKNYYGCHFCLVLRPAPFIYVYLGGSIFLNLKLQCVVVAKCQKN